MYNNDRAARVTTLLYLYVYASAYSNKPTYKVYTQTLLLILEPCN